jgi:hypothetical protein
MERGSGTSERSGRDESTWDDSMYTFVHGSNTRNLSV